MKKIKEESIIKQLNFKTDVHLCDSIDDFLEQFDVGEKDCVFTMRMFEKYLAKAKDRAQFIFYDDYTKDEPDDITVEKILADIRKREVSRIIAIGGGSVIDTAKILALGNINRVQDIYREDFEIKKDKELLVIPTTCGTGSEVTNIVVMALKEMGTKVGKNHDEFFPNTTVLIPEVIENLPFNIMLACSIDALSHAVESMISPKATQYTKIFAVGAIEKILRGYKLLNENKNNVNKEIIELFVVGSNMAGISMSYAGSGIVHAIAMAFGFSIHLPHGEAIYMFFIQSMRFYNKANPNGSIKKFRELISAVFNCDETFAIEYLEVVLEDLLKVKHISNFDINKDSLDMFAESLLKNQQRLYVNSYVKPSKEEIVEILDNCY